MCVSTSLVDKPCFCYFYTMNRLQADVFSRREFLCACAYTAAAGAVCCASNSSRADPESPHEAQYYNKLPNQDIQCTLCGWSCRVPSGSRGRCGVRENRGGTYYSLVYGRPCTLNNDPIEKKPFFHVYPGTKAFSLATVGCNFRCKFCQNWDIAHQRPENRPTPYVTPEEIVRMAVNAGSRCLAYTYSEPTVFQEYVLDCSRKARAAGLGNVVVSNGFMSEQALTDLCATVTAIKIDLKSFSDTFYKDVCGGKLQPVQATLKRLSKSGVWFEIVVLLIPTLNDNRDELRQMTRWITQELGPDVPLHFSRFHPDYKLRNLPPTPPAVLEEAVQIARSQGCRFVYAGNLPGTENESTCCPSCKTVLVRRYGHMTLSNALKNGTCFQCGYAIPGVWG